MQGGAVTIVTQNERRQKLVRARPKSPEFLPEWRKCCPQIMERLATLGEITVDIADTGYWENGWTCHFCGTKEPPRMGVRIVAASVPITYPYASIDCLDLDEGIQP
jgi:hypothetical protein